MKIAINKCHGGFGLSEAAAARFTELTGISGYLGNVDRDSESLIQVIEELGVEAASDSCAELKIVEIPDGVDWYIEEYDGVEHVVEIHRRWY